MEAGEANLVELIGALPTSKRQFHGPAYPEDVPTPKDDDHLLGVFADAQRSASGLVPEWCDCKIERKEVWRRLGIPEFVIVPTLYSSSLVWDGTTLDDVPEFTVDADGCYAPCLEAATPVQTATDANCQSSLRMLLTRERQIVVKPSRGANSKGVLLCSLSDEAPAVRGESHFVNGSHETSATATATATATSTACRATHGGEVGGDSMVDELSVWVQTPQKQHKREGGTERMPFDELWRTHFEQNELLRGRFLIEPSIAHDHELCVLCIGGGRLLVLAGRSLMMERIVRVEGQQAYVDVPSDFDIPEWLSSSTSQSISGWKRATPHTRASFAAKALTQRVEGDTKGRSVAELMLDVSGRLAAEYVDGKPSSALRVDWFVRWGTEEVAGTANSDSQGGRAQVYLNEVENGFNPACLVGWYGGKLTLLALRYWMACTGGNANGARHAIAEPEDGNEDEAAED
jgi:hypothetical protein